MDTNGLPLGLGMGLAMNARAMENYGRMTEAEKEDLIFKCKDAKSKPEMQHYIDELAQGGGSVNTDENERDILGGPSIG